MGRRIILIRPFVLKVINNERMILTHHEIIDWTAKISVSVISQWIWVPNSSFTYPVKFTYFCIVDISQYMTWKVTKYGIFWPVFSCNLLRKSPYSVQIHENKVQKKILIWTQFTHYVKENKKPLLNIKTAT